jgi:hypothetical protein
VRWTEQAQATPARGAFWAMPAQDRYTAQSWGLERGKQKDVFNGVCA